MKITLPFHSPEKYILTQKFGEKFIYHNQPCTHKGIDYAMSKGTKIIAPFDGVVKRITPERTTGYGIAVYIEAFNGKDRIEVILAHLSVAIAEEGWKVKRGDFVGLSGRTGFWRGVNGYHIHFGISVNGIYVNPLPLLKIKENQEISLFDDKSKCLLGKYIVSVGDTLWDISEKYYGNGGHYMEIFRVNEDILARPNLIKPGQVLRIPTLKNLGI